MLEIERVQKRNNCVWLRKICDFACVGEKKVQAKSQILLCAQCLGSVLRSFRTVLYTRVVHKQTVDSQVITSQNEIICRQKIEQFVE